MPDNAQPGGTGDVYRTKDRAGVETQIVGIDVGIGGATELLMSPTNPMPVNLSSSAGGVAPVTQTLTAAGAPTLAGATSTAGSAVIDVSAAGNASFHLLAAAFVGTVVFEQSFDPAGAAGTWAAVPCLPEDATSAPMSSLTISTAAAYIRQFTQGMFGPALFRVRCSAFTSGSLTAYIKAGPGWIEGQPALAPSNSMIGAVAIAAPTTAAGSGRVTTSGTANTNTVILAADSARKGCLVRNASTTASLALAWGQATSATYQPIVLMPGQGYEFGANFAALALNAQSTAATQPVDLNPTA